MRKFFILAIFVLIYYFVKPTLVQAVQVTNPGSVYNGYNFSISTPKYFPSGLGTSGDACPVGCSVPLECANSQNKGNCGLLACQGGNAWTKYTFQNCVITDVDTEAKSGFCEPRYVQGGAMYSIGDKCVAGEPGLRSSNCTGIQSPDQYKTCCSNTTPSYVINSSQSPTQSDSCIQYATDTTNPPYEGSCLVGTHSIQCGFLGVIPLWTERLLFSKIKS